MQNLLKKSLGEDEAAVLRQTFLERVVRKVGTAQMKNSTCSPKLPVYLLRRIKKDLIPKPFAAAY